MMLMLESSIKECEEILDNKGMDDWDNQMFQGIAWCYNIVAEMIRYDKSLPYFDLKGNWKLLKKHKYDYAVINLQEWVENIKKEEGE